MDNTQLASLKQHLEDNPQIENIFFNKAGDWRFHKSKGKFLIGKTRDEVAEMDADEIAESAKEPAKAVKKDAVKLRKVDEVIADIAEATTAEAVDELTADDTRKTVLAAAAERKDALSMM